MSDLPQSGIGLDHPGSVECLISVPFLDELAQSAVATNLDRRGAVVHLHRDEGRLDSALRPDAIVEVQVGLPSEEGQAPRLLQCLGQVISRSVDKSQRLWLVLRFSQIYVRHPQLETGSGDGYASITGNRRGGRALSIAVGSRSGETPELSLITNKKEFDNA